MATAKATGGRDPDRLARQRHAQLVGEIVWAWNDLNKTLGVLFGDALDHPNPLLGQVIWTTLTNDQSQRDLLLAVMDWNSKAKPRGQDAVRWVLKQVGELAVYRNDVVHGPAGYSIGIDGVTTRFSNLGNSFKRWVRHHSTEFDLQTIMALLRDDVIKLEKYAAGLHLRGSAVGSRAPRRPKLKLREALRAESPQGTLEKPKVARAKAQRPQRVRSK